MWPLEPLSAPPPPNLQGLQAPPPPPQARIVRRRPFGADLLGPRDASKAPTAGVTQKFIAADPQPLCLISHFSRGSRGGTGGPTRTAFVRGRVGPAPGGSSARAVPLPMPLPRPLWPRARRGLRAVRGGGGGATISKGRGAVHVHMAHIHTHHPPPVLVAVYLCPPPSPPRAIPVPPPPEGYTCPPPPPRAIPVPPPPQAPPPKGYTCPPPRPAVEGVVLADVGPTVHEWVCTLGGCRANRFGGATSFDAVIPGGRGGGGGGHLLSEGGGVWDPNVCAPKMAQPDFPDGTFQFFPRWSLGSCPWRLQRQSV